MFKCSKTGSVVRAALPFAAFATKQITKLGEKGFRAVNNQLDGRVEDTISDLENALQKFELDQLIDKVRSIDPIAEVRNLRSVNKALETEVEDLRAQLAQAIAPKKKGLGGWRWLIAFATCGLGLFIAAAWWLYGSDDDDLFDEFDDFTLLDTDRDIPSAHDALEATKANAERLIEDADDKTVDLS